MWTLSKSTASLLLCVHSLQYSLLIAYVILIQMVCIETIWELHTLTLDGKEVKKKWTYLLFPLRVHPPEISRVLVYQCYWWSLASEHHQYQMHSVCNTSYHLQHWNQPGLKPHSHCHCHSHCHWQQWWCLAHHLSHLLMLCLYLCQSEDQQGPTVGQHIERGWMICCRLLPKPPEMCWSVQWREEDIWYE